MSWTKCFGRALYPVPLTAPVAMFLIRKALQEETYHIAKSPRDETWLTGKGAASRSQLVLKMLSESGLIFPFVCLFDSV